jgi:exodeoxyribonuclease VII small subunit
MPAKTSTAKSKAAASDDDISFEDALDALEQLVSEMEGDDLPLEKMLSGYERGVHLRRLCDRRLEEAESKVEMIRQSGSSAKLESFDPAGESSASVAVAEAEVEEGGSDGELF